MKDVIEFLELNGFKEIAGAYTNGKSVVEIFDENYSVYNAIAETKWYSKDLTIYTLIGYLTYYNLMDKNYKTNK
jgi:hypothetical protein